MADNPSRARQEPLILPIGHFTGVFPDGDDPRGRRYDVRLGDEIVALPEAGFGVWVLCHGHPGDAAEASGPAAEGSGNGRPWTRSEALAYAQAKGVSDAAATVRELAGAGLVVEAPTAGRQARQFAESHRLRPSLLGLGNSPEEPDMFQIGLVGTPMAQVSRDLFEIWRWSGVAANIWDACMIFTDSERAHGESFSGWTDPEEALTSILSTAHQLLSAGAAYLDQAD